jgi:hypothetical protein
MDLIGQRQIRRPEEEVIYQRKPLAEKYVKILRRRYLVIRIPNELVPQLCNLMECRHDHPRRIVMGFIYDGLRRAQRKK